MSQTTGYGFALDKAQPGQKYDLMFDQVDSYAAEGAIPFGRAVTQGTSDEQCKLAAAAGTFLGVALFTQAVEQTLAGVAQYVDKSTVSVGRLARAWVDAVGAVTKEADAYVITTVGANQGKFTASTSGTLGPVGKFITSGEDEIVVVEVTSALRGPQGEQGPQGPQGDPGPQGPQGDPGL